MLIKDLLKKLSYNELANLSMAGEGSGVISPAQIDRIVSKTNDALVDIYTRFLISEKFVTITCIDGRVTYPLHQEFAVQDPTEDVDKFIIDSEEDPFLGDVLNILAVSDELGTELYMNDVSQCLSVFIPQVDTVQIPYAVQDMTFYVTYRAKHPELIYNFQDQTTLDQKINIPISLQQALRYKIAYGIFSAMSGQDYTNKCQEMDNLYEKACMIVEAQGLMSYTDNNSTRKFHERGFV